MKAFVFGIIAAVFVTACQESTEPVPESYAVTTPAHFPPTAYDFAANPVTRNGFALGKMLFYDPILSVDSSVSCGTCHRQTFAFADHDHRVSHGVNGKLGNRNTPAIFNLAWRTDFFWDGGVNHLDVLPLAPITNPDEMGDSLVNVIVKLNRQAQYRNQFRRAFGSDSITTQRLFRALSQFITPMVSAHSRYDRYVRQEGEALTETELAGLRIFEQKCATCHAGSLFTDNSFRNNGLNADVSADPGRELITHQASDRSKFRVPTLRNVALTMPYMHDGRFGTLDAVLAHYQSGIRDSPTLDLILKPNGQPGIPLSDAEKDAIIAFLHTLTDTEFTSDKRFAEPHK